MNLAALSTRYARRPLLLEPTAARALLQQIALGDPRGMQTEGRFAAILRKIGVGRSRPMAQDVHDDAIEAAAADAEQRPTLYAPLWAQQAYGDPQDEGFGWSLYEGAALLEIDGAISAKGEYYCGEFYHGYDTILAAMQEACADSRVGGLFVRVNSPGGVVDEGLPTLAAFMRANRAQAGGKPIHVYADMAASAAYWVSAQADRIAAGGVGLVGSIGAVLVHEDWSEALKKAGVVITPIQFGSQKTAGAWWDALSPDAREDLQAEIDQCGRNFVADVHAGRALLSAEAALATQARVFMAKHDDPTRSGLALNLVDAIETEQQAFETLLARIQSPNSAPKTGITASGAATGARVAAQAQGDPPMRFGLPKTRPNAAKPAAQAETAKAGDMMDCETCEGSGENPDGSDCGMCGGTGQVKSDDGADASAASANAVRVARTPRATVDHAAQISASAEAESHPKLALAAIKSGMTLAQFQATVAAAPPATASTSRLDSTMAGSLRLRPDAPKAEGAPKRIDAAGYYAKRAKAMGQGKTSRG